MFDSVKSLSVMLSTIHKMSVLKYKLVSDWYALKNILQVLK